MAVHPLAQEEEIAEVELAANAGTRTPANDSGFDLRQVPFLVIGETLEQLFTHHHAEDGITQELESLIRGESRVRTGSMSQGRPQELALTEAVLDRLLAFLQNLGLAAGCQFLRHKTHDHCGC